MATMTGNVWKYDSRSELIEDVMHNEDVTFVLNGTTYNMGATPQNMRELGICPDGDFWVFHSADEQLTFVIDGKPLIDWWSDMDLLN